MAKEEWRKVADEADLKLNRPVKVTVGEDEVLVVRTEEGVCAVGNSCTHYGAPLTDGAVCGNEVTCPWHNSRFDVTNGLLTSPPALDNVPQYPLKVEDGAVYIGRPETLSIPEPEGHDDRTFVIAGAGAAGNAAAEQLRRDGFAGRIVMITAEGHVPYDRPNLSKEYMAGEAEPSWIPLRDEEFYKKLRIELWQNKLVDGVDVDGHEVTFADGDPLKFDKLLLATGGLPRSLGVPGVQKDNIFLLRTLDDADAILGVVGEGKKAVMVGASFIALEVGAALMQRDCTVEFVAPEDVPMARIFGERIGKFLQSKHEEKGAKFHLGNTVKEFTGGDKVEKVVISNGKELDCDFVVLGLGVLPNVEFLRETGLVEDGAIPVDERLQTKHAGIYAAGDIAVVANPRTGEKNRIEHWTVAQRHGQHVARMMLGGTDSYDDVAFFWTKQHGMSLKYIGHAEKWDRIAYRGNVEDGAFTAGYYQDGRLRAAAGLQMAKDIIILGEVMRAGKNVPPEELEDPTVDLRQFL